MKNFNLIFLLPIGLYLFLQLSAWQVFSSNFYAQNVKAAPGLAHVAGFILFAFSVVWTVLTARDSNHVSRSDGANIAIIVGSSLLSLLSYAGFAFNVA